MVRAFGWRNPNPCVNKSLIKSGDGSTDDTFDQNFANVHLREREK